jgi:hypothetical protein
VPEDFAWLPSAEHTSSGVSTDETMRGSDGQESQEEDREEEEDKEKGQKVVGRLGRSNFRPSSPWLLSMNQKAAGRAPAF